MHPNIPDPFADYQVVFLGIFLLLLLALGRRKLVDAISYPLDLWLRRKYPVRHIKDASLIPTLPYRFPNGQGDAAKFLHGRANSEQWRKQYGPVYRLWSGMAPEIVLTNPEDIKTVFKDSNHHIKAVDNNSGYMLNQILGQCVGLISQGDWKRVRAICEGPFLRPMSTAYLPLMQRRTQRHFEELATSPNLLKSVIDPTQDLKMLPFWIIAEILYGGLSPQMEAELTEMAPMHEAIFQRITKGGLARFHWSRYLPTKSNRNLWDFQTRWASFNLRACSRALEMNIAAPIVDVYKALDAGAIGSDQLLHTLDEILYANLDVTLGGLSWNLVFLAAHSAAQGRLHAEIVEHRAAADFNGYLSSSSTFLASCIQESSRLRPLAAFSVPQAAPSERVAGGYRIPAGTNFVVDSYALNHSTSYWGEDATSYRPERFLGQDYVQARYNFWRFGFGPRQCMGKYVADLIIRVILAHLVECFEIKLLHNENSGRYEEVWIDHPQTQLQCIARF